MPLLTESEVRTEARKETQRMAKAATSILRDQSDTFRSSFDVFLSHSRLDSEIVLGVKLILEATDLTVYVDWVDDLQLDRSNVSPATAQKLREGMRQSVALFYLHSANASTSRWMPWELGYFDGQKGNVAILPVVRSLHEGFRGEEYLGLYPYVDVTGRTDTSPGSVWIHRSGSQYARFRDWRDGSDKLRPAA